MNKENITVVICAAGMGTRLGIGTPKSLIYVCGKPIIIRLLELLKDFDDIRIVLGFQSESVINVVNEYRKDIMFVFNNDYQNTGPGASLSKGIINAREYVVSIDGDMLINPKDFDAFIDYEGECIAISNKSSDEPVSVLVKDGKAISFSSTGEYEWAGLVKVRKNSLKNHIGFIYEMLGDALPIDVLKIGTRDIDTQDDYERTVNWVENGYK